MNHFNFKKRKLFTGPHLLGTLLIVAGLFALFSPYMLEVGTSMERVYTVGISSLLLGLLIVSFYQADARLVAKLWTISHILRTSLHTFSLEDRRRRKFTPHG